MTSIETSADINRRLEIVNPYRHDPASRDHRIARRWAIGVMVAFCFFWGLVFAFVAPALPVLFLMPVAILALLAIWALPDLRVAPTRTAGAMFLCFVAILIVWPPYLALSLHQFGIPWLSFQRLVSIPLALVFLICVSSSRDVRARLSGALRAEPLIWVLLVAFVAIQTFALFISPRVFAALDTYVSMQTTWTLMFFVACYFFTKPRWVERWAATIWAAAIPVGFVALLESRVRHVLWVGHLPSFLQMDPLVAKELTPGFRNFTAIYRVQSTFGTSLGLGEYIALTMPFVLHFALGPYRRPVRVAAAVTAPFLTLVAYITNARSALIGVLIGFGLYGLYWGVMKWRRHPRDLMAQSILLSYPVVALAGLASTFIFGRVHRAIWGGGEQMSSTLSRVVQYQTGIPKVFSHPWGYGINQAGITLGFFAPGGLLTIDTYYLFIALDYGILGFIIYFGMFYYGLFTGSRHALLEPGIDRETSFLAPAAMSLAAFLVIKFVFAEPGNHPLFFMVLGMVPALVWRTKMDLAAGEKADTVGPLAEG